MAYEVDILEAERLAHRILIEFLLVTAARKEPNPEQFLETAAGALRSLSRDAVVPSASAEAARQYPVAIAGIGSEMIARARASVVADKAGDGHAH